MAKETIRQVKLHGKYRPSEKVGFSVGSEVEITVQNNLLIVKKATGDGTTGH